ncbi:MAG TPA: MFS transporter [Hyphomonas sp.]|nr:MFS transporter [Hyphomonas sp.]MCB9963282.1 MFS transporter [Hyphomonas sp.]MCB9972387.1 MFS transporter [Hyphomonas sp.]HPE47940.1 MFS transporter [Hyphomonas sp.]
MTDTRNVFALIVAVMILQIAGGLTAVLTPLGLEAMGTPPQAIGLIAALHAAGFMLGAWTAPRALAGFGNIRLFAAASALNAVSVLCMSLLHGAMFWAPLRLMMGISFAYMFTSVESWLGSSVPEKSRGHVMGIYHTGAKLSLILGPFFVAGLSPLDTRAYTWAAMFLTLALVPVCLTQQEEPPAPQRKAMPLREIYALAPAAVIGVLMAGVINTGAQSLLPVYFEDFKLYGGGTGAAAVASGAAWLGGLIMQWPAGRLSDHVERRLVIAGICTLSGLAALLIAVFGKALGEVGVIVVLGFWGAGSLSFYGLSVAHAIDRTPRELIPHVMSGLLFVWAGGSISGPLIAGFAMRGFGRLGLFGLMGVLLLLVAVMMVWRVRAKPMPVGEKHEEWSPILPTPLASVEIDPRMSEQSEQGELDLGPKTDTQPVAAETEADI